MYAGIPAEHMHFIIGAQAFAFKALLSRLRYCNYHNLGAQPKGGVAGHRRLPWWVYFLERFAFLGSATSQSGTRVLPRKWSLVDRAKMCAIQEGGTHKSVGCTRTTVFFF